MKLLWFHGKPTPLFYRVSLGVTIVLAAIIMFLKSGFGEASSPFIIAAFGDYGCQSGASCQSVSTQQEQAVANMVLGWSPDAIVTLGDNSYEYACASGAGFAQATANDCSGTNDILNDQAPYDQPGGPIQTGIFYPAIGNHDDNFNWNNYLYGGSGSCTSATVVSDVSNCSYLYNRPPHYVAHLDSGLVSLFVVNSNNHDPDGDQSGSAQNTWYSSQASSSTATWKIETEHHPRWSSGEHGSNNYINWTVNNNIDLFMAGHDHNSEHIVRGGQNFIVEGTGGKNLRTGTVCNPFIKSSGITYSANGLTITDPSQAWDTDKLSGRTVTVAGQTRNITGNTATTITVDSAFSPVPASGTQYQTSNCVVGSQWHDDTHYGAVKLTITSTQLKAQYYATDGTVLHSFSIYKNTSVGSVSGMVKDASGNPIANTKVSFADGDTYTDANGNYSFSQIPVGSVPLTAKVSGYQSNNQTVTVNNGSNTSQDFTLTSSGIIFASGFETGNTSEWTSTSANMTACSNSVSCPTNSGGYAIEGNTTTGPADVLKNTGSTYSNINTRMYFDVKSRSTNVSMIYDRTASNAGIFHLLMDTSNRIVLRNDVKLTTTNSCVTVSNPLNQWHQLETNLSIPGSGNSGVQAWLDGTQITWPGTDGVCGTGDDTSTDSEDFTTGGVEPAAGQLIIGDTATSGRNFDMLMDDGAFSSTGYIGSAYGTISGKVTSQEDGSNISGATVTASWTFPDTSSTGSTSITTDASGNYSFSNANCLTNHTGCVPGDMAITLTADSPPTFVSSQPATTFLAFNGSNTGQDFVLGESPATLTGTVSDAVTGIPISGATITDPEGSVNSDASGVYSQSLEPDSPIIVSASATGYQNTSASVSLSPGFTTNHDFALTPSPGTITGNVKNNSNNANLVGVTISYSGGSTTTDSNGNYTLNNVPAEVSQSLTASLTGYNDANANVTVSPAGNATHNFSLTPTPVIGDFNGDSRVNLTDLSILLTSWGSSNATTDLNHNGKVDLVDLSIFLSHWTG